MDSVPDHRECVPSNICTIAEKCLFEVRWNSKNEDDLFMKQSATLYATYYHLQILIHRPFIPSFRNPSPTTFPSLAICTNAARSCCHVLEVQSKNGLPFPIIQVKLRQRTECSTDICVQITIFHVALVLLLNIWSGKRSGIAPHPRQEMEDVKKCLDLLKACEHR